MTKITRPKRKKPNRLRVILLVVVLFAVLYILSNAEQLTAYFLSK